ncbi:MAG: MoxR family ATPase [Chitinophagaceae bacterium]|nr:MoxR family ATPase [Chitinophagaceae bacterium]
MEYENRNETEVVPAATEQMPALIARMQEQMGKVIVGQQEMLELLLAALLADGHVLIEGVPGVAKTLTARLMARMLAVDFSRIQFTPDLMPSDVTGTSVFNSQSASFQFRQGPIFSNIVLIDEINRAPAKTQASLFEVMEEKQVTIDGFSYKMQSPFMVLATQNPIEHEGTYRLPEAQLDRFIMKINVAYPSLEEEISILTMQNRQPVAELVQEVSPIVTPEELKEARRQVRSVFVEEKIIAYIAQIVFETRNDRSLYVGASPRASIALLNVAKAVALIRGRNFVIPEDVAYAVLPVLRHRISLTPEREMEGSSADEVLKELLKRIEVPR